MLSGYLSLGLELVTSRPLPAIQTTINNHRGMDVVVAMLQYKHTTRNKQEKANKNAIHPALQYVSHEVSEDRSAKKEIQC
jgi:ATP adenylyltransferase/5',5'''-P-1,P-4-tetraphosphate phosphorylase II